MMGMRTFIAIEISEDLRRELTELQEDLRKSDADVKWVNPQNLHLTLKFLGDTSEETISEVKEILENITRNTRTFEVIFAGIGVFPKLDFPRVVWVGIEKGKDELIELAKEIEKELTQIGSPKEKRGFSAHLTLGRVRSPKNKDKLKKIILTKQDFQSRTSMRLDKIIFFRSRLTPRGPIYTVLGKFNLSSL
jgi:2'-5' RNA ligase